MTPATAACAWAPGRGRCWKQGWLMLCAKAATPASAFRYTAGERAAAFYWADGKVAYVVSGPADRDKLEKVAKAAYEQMERDDAKRS
jgi:anti-sigma factor RsiW